MFVLSLSVRLPQSVGIRRNVAETVVLFFLCHVGIDKFPPSNVQQLGTGGISWEWHIVEGVASQRADASRP